MNGCGIGKGLGSGFEVLDTVDYEGYAVECVGRTSSGAVEEGLCAVAFVEDFGGGSLDYSEAYSFC